MNKKILILGAGKSATDLIRYLLNLAPTYNWEITVGDMDIETAKRKVGNHKNAKAIFFDVNDQNIRNKCIENTDIVASILPASMHYIVALDCLKFGKHLITPSYVSPKEKALHQEFINANLLFMGEIGLDPGIDHLTLMKMITELKLKQVKILSIKSSTGALIAPESDDNPWHYKFTWAPMNVVLAGQSTAQYLENKQISFTPYNRLFKHNEIFSIDGYGNFESYPNRDSLPYLQMYDIEEVPTFIRSTLRKEGFCKAWDALVQLGWTDNTLEIKNTDKLTYQSLLKSFLPKNIHNYNTLKEQFAAFLNLPITSQVLQQLEWLGIFEPTLIRLKQATPAQILLELLQQKWILQPNDIDMVVMLHQIDYEEDNKIKRLTSSMVVKGEDANNTAISKYVGIPMAIVVKLIAMDKIKVRGVQIPIMPEIYEPCLNELKDYGVEFTDKIEILD